MNNSLEESIMAQMHKSMKARDPSKEDAADYVEHIAYVFGDVIDTLRKQREVLTMKSVVLAPDHHLVIRRLAALNREIKAIEKSVSIAASNAKAIANTWRK